MQESNLEQLKRMDWPERVAYISAYLAITLLMVYLFQTIWNLFLPEIFGLPSLSYSQALAIKAMVTLIK